MANDNDVEMIEINSLTANENDPILFQNQH